MRHSRHFLGDLVRYLPSQLAPAAVGLLSIPILTRLLSTEEFGYLSLTMSGAAMGLLLFGWMGQAVVRLYPQTSGSARSALVRTALAVQLGSIVVVCGLTVLVQGVILPEHSPWRPFVLLGTAIVAVRAVYRLLTHLLRTRMEALAYSAFTGWESAAGLALGTLLAGVGEMGAAGVLAGYLIANCVAIPLLLARSLRGVSLAGGRGDSLRSLVGFGLPLLPKQLGVWSLRRFDRFQVLAYFGPNEVGIYSAAYALANRSILLMAEAMSLLSLPRLADAWENEGEKAGLLALSQVTRYYLKLGLPMLFGIGVLARPILELVAGARFSEGWPVVPWVATGAFLFGLSQRFSDGLMLVLRARLLAVFSVSAAVINIVLNVWLVPLFGYVAAAVTTAIACGLLCAAQGIATRKYSGWRFPWRTAARALVAAVGMAAGIALARGRWLAALSPAWTIAVCVPLGVVLYAGLLLLVGEAVLEKQEPNGSPSG